MKFPKAENNFAPFDYVVNIPTRELMTPPSTKMISLLKEQPHLLKDINGDVCDMFEHNIIKSLIVKVKKKEVARDFRRTFGKVSRAVDRPFRVFSNVEFKTTDGKKVYLARTVIYKQSVGAPTGLVTTGDYAGLVLDFSKVVTRSELPTANKIWCNKSDMHYTRKYSIQIADIRSPDDHAFHIKVNATKTILDDAYKRWTNETKGKLDNTTEHLFYLCQLLNVPIDTKQFHQSLPVYINN